MYSLVINGATHEIDGDPQMPLLWVLRDKVALVGTKYGCGIGACGACTVIVDGAATRSCLMPLAAADGSTVTTIESVTGSEWETVQQAWIEKQVPQCGYCQSGMIMAAIALLQKNNHPSRDQIREAISNLCRCGTYQRVEDAILLVSAKLIESRKVAEEKAKERMVKKKRWRRKARSK